MVVFLFLKRLSENLFTGEGKEEHNINKLSSLPKGKNLTKKYSNRYAEIRQNEIGDSIVSCNFFKRRKVGVYD